MLISHYISFVDATLTLLKWRRHKIWIFRMDNMNQLTKLLIQPIKLKILLKHVNILNAKFLFTLLQLNGMKFSLQKRVSLINGYTMICFTVDFKNGCLSILKSNPCLFQSVSPAWWVGICRIIWFSYDKTHISLFLIIFYKVLSQSLKYSRAWLTRTQKPTFS